MNSTAPIFRILLIGTQMATGGSQTGLLDQARCFHARGCKVVVAFLYDRDDLHKTWQQSAEFPIHNLQAYKKGATFSQNAALFLRGMSKLWHLLRHERFDVIETFTHDSNLVGLPIAWLAGIPVRIATHRGVIENFPRWREKLHTWMINSGIAQVLVAVSKGMGKQSQIEGVHDEKIVVINNGVTPLDVQSVDTAAVRQQLDLKDADRFLLSVGRVTHQKGHDVLIDAVPGLIQHHPNLVVSICGDGPQMSDLKAQISKLGLSDRVKLLGTWTNVAPLLAIADIFILPSRSEGLSRALLEAMAAGLPIVSTRVDGVADVAVDGVHGLLVPPGDPVALGKALIRLVDDPQLRKRMGDAAREHVLASYTTDIMFDKYYKLMVNLLETKSISGDRPVS